MYYVGEYIHSNSVDTQIKYSVIDKYGNIALVLNNYDIAIRICSLLNSDVERDEE